MAGSKNYQLKVWPQNNAIYNTKKYTIIKRASVPLHTRILFAVLLSIFVYYYYLHNLITTTASNSFNYNLLVIALQRSNDCLHKIFLNLFILLAINYVLASVILQNDIEESVTMIKNMGVELISTSSTSSFLPSSNNSYSFWLSLVSLITNNFFVNTVLSMFSYFFFFLNFFSRNAVKHEETFIPIEDIEDIIIHEAFKGFEVIFYMVILRKSTKKLTIVFKNLLPRRHQLETVLQGSRKVLFYGRDDDMLKLLVNPSTIDNRQ